MKVCPKCGKKFPDEYAFCKECGSELKEKTRVLSRGKEVIKYEARPRAGEPKVTWGYRQGFEFFFTILGLSLLAGGSFLARGLMGSTPNLALLILPAVAIAVGVVSAVSALWGADSKARAIGGHAFTAVGMGLLIFSLMTAYERMGAPPQLGNVPWISIMIAIGVFTTLMGISLVHELGIDNREAWGNVLAATGFVSLLFFVFAVRGLVGRAPAPENIVWLSIMISIAGFLMWKGFLLALEHKGRTGKAWGVIFLVAAVPTLICSILLAKDISYGTIETVNLAWLGVLLAVFSFLLVKGIGRVRESKTR